MSLAVKMVRRLVDEGGLRGFTFALSTSRRAWRGFWRTRDGQGRSQ